MRGVFVFYDVYVALCAERGEKPYQLAIELGLKSNSAVAQWAKGSIPRPAMLEKIADHFGVSVGYLLTGEKEDPAPAESQGEITRKEQDLVLLFRSLPEDLQDDLLSQLRSVLERRGLLPPQS